MKTVITIRVIAADTDKTADVQNAIEAAFAEFDRIVETYTRFADTSELSALNRKGGQWMPVSDEFLMLIQTMLDLASKSNGAYDPTIIDLLEAYGYSARYDFAEKLADQNLKSIIENLIKTRPSFHEIELDAMNKKVKLAKGQRLDLGSIGKGYAMDCAYDQLDKFDNFIIDAGGDIRCKGMNESGLPWQVGLKHYQDGTEGYIGKVAMTEGSLCSSGSWARRVGDFHHLLNTSTGAPENRAATVYVGGNTAMQSDGWSTVLYLTQNLELLPAGVNGLLINSDQTVVNSPDFPEIYQL